MKRQHGRGPGMAGKFENMIGGYQDDIEEETLARGGPAAGVQSGLQKSDDALQRQLDYLSQDKADTLQENRKIGRTNAQYGAGYGSWGTMGGGSGFGGHFGRGNKNQKFADTAPHPEGTPLGGRFGDKKPKATPSAQTQQPQPQPGETDPFVTSTPTPKKRPAPGQGKRPVAPGMGDGGMFAQMKYVRENYPFEWSMLSQMFFDDSMSPFQLNGLIGSIYQSDLQRYRQKQKRDEKEVTIA